MTLKNISIILITLLFTACKKLIEIDPPKNQLVTSVVFKDSSDISSAVQGIYIKMVSSNTIFNMGNGAITAFTGLSADELLPSSAIAHLLPLYNNAIPKEFDENNGLWRFAYESIYQVNACLEGINPGPSISASLRSQLNGELYFLRAFYYFLLVNLYGDVPLVTTSDYKINQSLGRSPVAAIYHQMEEDLQKSQQLLPANYVTSFRARPNRYTAMALLARVYLYQGKWQEAESTASAIIQSGKYQLETPDLAFLSTSKETIWHLRPVLSTGGVAEGVIFIPITATRIPSYIVTNDMVNSFEPGDRRKTSWIKFTGNISGQIYPYPFKYKLRSSTTVDESYTVLRYAEVLLIRAEARAQLNNIAGGSEDVNVLRARAGLPIASYSSKEILLAAITRERRSELFCEWGHRWFDLKRTNSIHILLGASKPGWKPEAALYPIPNNEMNANPHLVQNPGY